MEVLSLCPFRAGALAWQSAPDAWSLTVVVKASFTIVAGGEATLAPVQTPVVAFAADSEAAVEDLSPLKPRVDVLVLRGRNEDTATVELASTVLPARGPIPPYAPARRLVLQDHALEWATAVLRGEAASAGPAPQGFDFNFFHVAPRDQRIDLLRTGVPLVLNDVLPNHARIETIVPQRKPQAFRIHPQTGKASEIILRCDTVCIDAARGLLVLTFRGITDIDGSQNNLGTIVVAAHSAGKKIRADRIERFLRNGEPIEGESNDGRHPLEKRYDTVLAAPKGDTMALPEMDHATSGVWQAAPLGPSDSAIMRAGGGLPFQPPAAGAPPPPVPPAPLNAPIGGRRLGTLVTPAEPGRAPDMPFQGQLPPPVPEALMPPLPPEGVFPPPPAMLGVASPTDFPPLIRPSGMRGGSFTPDEKTADLPPGHQESPEEKTLDLEPHVAAATLRMDGPLIATDPSLPAPPAPVPPSLAGKPAGTPAGKPAFVSKSATAIGLGPQLKAALDAPSAPPPPTAPKAPIPAPTAPKPVAAAAPASVTAKPTTSAAPAAAIPKPAPPKVTIKAPAPLGPKLKTDGPAKPLPVAPSVGDKKPATSVPDRPAVGPAIKPVALAKPAPVPLKATPGPAPKPAAVKPGIAAAAAVVVPALPAKPAAVSTAARDPFHASDALKLEECAALEAELRHRPAARKELLEKNQLSDEQWLEVHKHWSSAIARQTEVGERKLLVAYDAAYVAVQERLGVNVGIDTYAKLQVAAERGTSGEVLKAAGLEPADQMRLGRVWTQRLADEPARMRELSAAIEKARAG